MSTQKIVLYSVLAVLSIFIGFKFFLNFGVTEKFRSVAFNSKSYNKKATNTKSNPKKEAELCDRMAVLEKCNTMIGNNDARSCINLSDRFFEKCGNYDQLHFYRNAAARRLSEWKIALESSDQLVRLYPYNADMYFKRALTYEEMGDNKGAIKDYEQTLALLPREMQSPFSLATLYQREGEPCLGISPLEQFSYFYPDRSGSSESILNTLYRNPKCSDMQGTGKAQIQINTTSHAIKSKVVINDKFSGNFIVDTGASSVVMTKSFAKRIGLDFTSWPTINSQTANGMIEGYYGFVDKIALQGVEAKHIEVMIANDLGAIDGLLGLSFLSRFKIQMDAEKGYLILDSKRE